METRDRGFKYAFENDPRGLLHLTGRLSITAKAEVRVLGTELLAPGKLADSLVLVETESGRWLDHTEALSWWSERERLAITRRALTGVLIPKYETYDLYPTILLMLEDGMPKRLPRKIVHDRGGAFGGIRPNWVKLWEADAGELLELDRRHLMHLVPLMRHRKSHVREAGRRIREVGDEGQITLFLMLGERGYDKNELRRWVGMFHDAVVQIGKTTSFGQELMDLGRDEGRAEMISAIRSFLARTFPRLAGDPAIDAIPSLQQASQIMGSLCRAATEREAAKVLRAIGSRSSGG